jgi:putative hydrolase of the HAD superfamily
MVNAVLFDAGFTLVDLVKPVVEVYLGAAHDLGAEIDASAFGVVLKRRWARLETDHRKRNPDLKSSEELERLAWRNFTSDLASEFPSLADRHGDWHHRLVNHFDNPSAWRPAPFAREALQALQEAGVQTAVVSNWHSALLPILESHGLRPFLEFALTSAEAGRKKPHREIFEKALARMGTNAAETAFVGDSWSDDVLGALQAGLAPVYLQRANEPPPKDSRVRVIRSLSEIPPLFTKG